MPSSPRNLLYVLVFVILVFAVFILSKGGLRRAFHGAPRSLAEVATVSEDIREMDLDALIAEAERANDLRRAIRCTTCWYCASWWTMACCSGAPSTRTATTCAQIKDPALRDALHRISPLVFQWVWYGHAEVDAERYGSIKRPFLEFERAPAL